MTMINSIYAVSGILLHWRFNFYLKKENFNIYIYILPLKN